MGKYVPPEGSLEKELMSKDKGKLGRLLVGWLLILMTVLLCFTTLTTCEVNATKLPPMVIDPTYGKLVWESEDGKVKMYRIVDRVEGLTVICYPTVGQLHGKTVSNFCIYKPSRQGD